MGKYDDMFNMPHHVSSDHLPMSIRKRAAQFAPFAALSGYGDSIEETGRLTCEKAEPDEQQKELLNAAIKRALNEPGLRMRIVYFVPDMLKDGGEYVSCEGTLSKVDDIHTRLVLTDGRTIQFDDIYSIGFI